MRRRPGAGRSRRRSRRARRSRSTRSPTGSTCATPTRGSRASAGVRSSSRPTRTRSRALGYVELGIGQARRAWLTKQHIVEYPAAGRGADRRRSADDGLPRGRRTRRSTGPRDTSSGWATCPCSRRCEPGECARGCRHAARAGRAVRGRAARPRRDPPAGDDALAAAAVLRATSRSRAPSRGSSPSCSPRRSTQVGFLWRTSPASTELEGVVLDWVAELLGLPAGLARPHRGHRVDVDARRADRARRHTTGQATSSSAPSTPTRRSRRR